MSVESRPSGALNSINKLKKKSVGMVMSKSSGYKRPYNYLGKMYNYVYGSRGKSNTVVNKFESKSIDSFESNDKIESLKGRTSQDTLLSSSIAEGENLSLNPQHSDSNVTLLESEKLDNHKFNLRRLSTSPTFSSSTTLVENSPNSPTEKRSLKDIIVSHNYEAAYEAGQKRHLHFYELPFPWRENKYIVDGYRFYHANSKLALSIFNWYGMHNETTNIWTHLLGAVYLAYLALYDLPSTFIFTNENVPKNARYMVYVFLIAGIKCMLASVFWHTSNGTTSIKLRPKFCCVDYTGITILITASILSAEFVALHDFPIAMYCYMSLSTFFGVCGLYLNWSPKFDSPEARPLRIKFFVLLAAVGGLSFLHLVFLRNANYAGWLLYPVTRKSVIWYLIGVGFYGSFIPERFRSDYVIDATIPTTEQLASDISIITKDRHLHFRAAPTKKCNCGDEKNIGNLWWIDYIGNSHNIWHIFVLLGVIGHYNAILDMFAKKWL